jgi:hypothetical protein
MKSYASVEEIDDRFAACELEMIPVEESKTGNYAQKPTEMIDIPIEMVTSVEPDIKEGDIIEVIHGCGIVSCVCGRDDAEKQRRVALIESLLEN